MRRATRLLATALWIAAPPAQADAERLLMGDDFESGTAGWELTPGFASVVDSSDAEHGRVLQLEPAGGLVSALFNRIVGRPIAEPVSALLRGSEHWGAIRLEGELYFPTDDASYLGVIYHHVVREGRADFGSVYVIARPEESYIRANPHYDGNPARALYEEFRVDLEGADQVGSRVWVPFAFEIVHGVAHFYVGDLSEPRLTFPLFDRGGGRIGLNPRSLGGPVWIDRVRVWSIDQHSYAGPARPRAPSTPARELLTEWEALGPRSHPDEAVEAGQEVPGWTRFETDVRGAVLTARLLEYQSERRVGYFRTRVASTGPARLELSTSVPLTLWVDGKAAHVQGPRIGRFDLRRVAWFDFREPGPTLELQAGEHEVLVRVDSDYSGVGFFARLLSF